MTTDSAFGKERIKMDELDSEKYLYKRGWIKERTRMRWLWYNKNWPHGLYLINDAVRLQQKDDRKNSKLLEQKKPSE